jgi:hypothetical protein
MKLVPLLLLAVAIAGCPWVPPVDPTQPDQGSYALAATYDSIRSYPGGGGIFVLRLSPLYGFKGTVQLRVEADASLGASVTKRSLISTHRIAEVLLAPKTTAVPGWYTATVVSAHAGVERRLRLSVHVMEWTGPDTADALAQREQFRIWCVQQRPELAEAFSAPLALYNTYPEILIVEHRTFLTGDFEVRVCNHVMVPPDDWSMLRLRKRDSAEPFFAARRESDGTIREIPVAQYPELCGY